MDYSKVKFVTPSVGCKYFTRGKVYAFEYKGNKAGYVTADDGEKTFIFIPSCGHLDHNPWIPCHEDGTPLTKEFTALEAEMLDLLNRISGELLRSDFVLSEKWYDKIAETIKKAKQ